MATRVTDRFTFIDHGNLLQRGPVLDELELGGGVLLWDPKYPFNVGSALRACASFGIPQLWLTGERMLAQLSDKTRLPREERMKGYGKVRIIHSAKPFEHFPSAIPRTCIELLRSSQPLAGYVHPEDAAIYVFGQEDGNVPAVARRHCHHFVRIESEHCLNLAAAVNVVLYHRRLSRYLNGLEPMPALDEERGYL